MSINNGYILKNVNEIKCIYDITKFSQLDFPEKLSCIIWFSGCNMRCNYCYNPQIVFGKGKLCFNDVLKFIKTRVNLLDGVVFSGGECTAHKNIINYAKEIKQLGFLLKVDTNGSYPDVIKQLISNNLVDFISLDYKSTEANFKQITKSSLHNKFEETLNTLINSNIKFEVRTTLHSFNQNSTDILAMHQYLIKNKYPGNYYLQFANTNVSTIEKLPSNNHSIFADLKKESSIIFR